MPGDYVFTGMEYVRIGDLRQEGGGSTLDSSSPVATEDFPPELAEKVTASNVDPAVRLDLMVTDSVDSEVIQGTNMLLAMRVRDVDLINDCARVFNDYCAEYCSQDPNRLVGTAMIPTYDVEWATKELERVAKKGMRSAIINTDLPTEYEPYRSPKYDRLWAAACEHDFPLTLHLGTGKTRDPFTLITPEEKGEVPGLYLDIFDDGRPRYRPGIHLRRRVRQVREAEVHPQRVRTVLVPLLRLPSASDAGGDGLRDGCSAH